MATQAPHVVQPDLQWPAGLRGDLARLAIILLEVAMGFWLLLLFLLAVAWDPLDRRLGFHARRRTDRLSEASAAAHPGAPNGAYTIAPIGSGEDGDEG
jgi:hypothetical protein